MFLLVDAEWEGFTPSPAAPAFALILRLYCGGILARGFVVDVGLVVDLAGLLDKLVFLVSEVSSFCEDILICSAAMFDHINKIHNKLPIGLNILLDLLGRIHIDDFLREAAASPKQILQLISIHALSNE